jgi:hypothetical protein
MELTMPAFSLYKVFNENFVIAVSSGYFLIVFQASPTGLGIELGLP